ncbi:dicarboxylate/amino acid:cation symporter [uncultured Ruminobacter sp.]|jgi:Na+/H+-dicarboxylate symporter|uniref:dicarboxylate/amino acid:cation symporter n=1 Tax=Ruminobacter sp. TaxID=2774296 RepID=UPI0025CDFCDE|nr:dicarboxylate/amino acid:cation symporter [uncultured Ruminobacter sp.]
MTDTKLTPRQHTSWKYMGFYILAIALGVINGLFPTPAGLTAAKFISDIFIRMFSFVSVPIIAVTLCLTLATLGTSAVSKALWKRTLTYTVTTTVLAASVAALLYAFISPENYVRQSSEELLLSDVGLSDKKDYLEYFVNVFPDNILAPLVNGNILSVLLIAIITGIAIRYMRNDKNRECILSLLSGFQEIIFIIIKWIILILPLGLFGFISVCVEQFSSGLQIGGLASYFTVVVGANLIQGLIILPGFLLIKKLNPLKIFSGMFNALTVAFFSKSSAATLPITMECAEKNNGINPKVSRFVLPICTTINMNGCAAFILTTVMYLMQNDGAQIGPTLLIMWVGIASLAAIGNAGVPMGCYFLSASLLSSMGVPIELLGIIFPIYAVLDMIETALNVWSDSCIATVVDKDLKNKAEKLGIKLPVTPE